MSTSNLVAESVWQDMKSNHSERLKWDPTVTDDQFSILYFLFGKNLEKATRIVDQKGVKRISGEPSGRSIFQNMLDNWQWAGGACELKDRLHDFVVGESRRKEEYLCFEEHYCGCYAFFYDIVNRGEQLCCKHQLAARLASSIGACLELKLPDEELALLLSKL